METNDVPFELMDTGGIGNLDVDDLTHQVDSQIDIAMELAELLLFVVDIRDGVLPLDRTVADMVRRHPRPVWLIANKADDSARDAHVVEFFSLGLGETLPVSAHAGRGVRELRERLGEFVSALPPTWAAGEPLMKLAVVGRRNVGKSTLINALAGCERVITSEVAGTTRDAVDIRFEHNGHSFMAIDTAGLRKKASTRDPVEYYSRVRAEESIRRSDVALLMLDATSDVGRVDKQIAAYVVHHYRACLIVVNKWDLVPDDVSTEDFETYIRKTLTGLSFAPIAFLSATEGLNVEGTVDLAYELYRQMLVRVSTAEVNRVIEAAQQKRSAPARKGRKPRIYFATQTNVNPPTVILFSNFPAFFKSDYRRYLVNQLRNELPYSEVPVKLIFRMRS